MTVPWEPWSARVFAGAAAVRKPILLSIVTAWSDACVAMDETTYADPEVRALIAARFVPVRVDADRRPDINDRYNLGGWPTTVLLTGRGDVLSGTTYASPGEMRVLLGEVADAYRDRAAELGAAASRVRSGGVTSRRPAEDADLIRSVDRFRDLLIDQFDRRHGGFGAAPKLPHPAALLVALSLAGDGDSELAEMAAATLDRMWALWESGGGFPRYAEGADWSRPGSEKTLEDNAALLHVYVEAAHRLGGGPFRERAAALARWLAETMRDRARRGFANAIHSRGVDAAIYVDKNALAVGPLLRAAALFDDVWLRDLALGTIETVLAPAYQPGAGVAHLAGPDEDDGPECALLTDQIRAASALVWAHAATGRLPYSMLAAELVQFAVRTMWDDSAGAFRDRAAAEDPFVPFEVNCEAACVLDRLAVLTGDPACADRARVLLRSRAADAAGGGLFGAPHVLAIREVIDRRPPAALELGPVDWQLRHDG